MEKKFCVESSALVRKGAGEERAGGRAMKAALTNCAA